MSLIGKKPIEKKGGSRPRRDGKHERAEAPAQPQQASQPAQAQQQPQQAQQPARQAQPARAQAQPQPPQQASQPAQAQQPQPRAPQAQQPQQQAQPARPQVPEFRVASGPLPVPAPSDEVKRLIYGNEDLVVLNRLALENGVISPALRDYVAYMGGLAKAADARAKEQVKVVNDLNAALGALAKLGIQ